MPASDEVLANRLRDRDFMLWVKGLPCCAAVFDRDRCSGPIHAHHAGTERGMSQKAADTTCIPLCQQHHADWHGASGPFKTWNREARRDWALRMIGQTQARHARGDDGGGVIPW